MQPHRFSGFRNTPRPKIALDFLPSRSYHLQDDRKSDEHNEEEGLDGERNGEKRWTGTQGSLNTGGTFTASTSRHQHTMGAGTRGPKQEEQERLVQAPTRTQQHAGAMQEKRKRVDVAHRQSGPYNYPLGIRQSIFAYKTVVLGWVFSFARYPSKTNHRGGQAKCLTLQSS